MQRNSGKTTPRILTIARDLKRRKARERADLFVAEGVRVVEELLRARVPMRGALVTATLTETTRGAALASALASALATHGVECTTVDDDDFRSAAATENPQGVLAIGEVPRVSFASAGARALARVLVLDAIQDPGNVGTMIRTAAALGIDTVVALPGTADPWNAKVVRGGAGGHFHVNVMHAELDELLHTLKAHAVPLWAADAGGRSVGELRAPASLALAIGNEGAGLTAGVRSAATELVSLPMSRGVESLNAAVAAGILLYALRP